MERVTPNWPRGSPLGPGPRLLPRGESRGHVPLVSVPQPPFKVIRKGEGPFGVQSADHALHVLRAPPSASRAEARSVLPPRPRSWSGVGSFVLWEEERLGLCLPVEAVSPEDLVQSPEIRSRECVSCSILVSKSFFVFLAVSKACLSSVWPRAWDLCRDSGMVHRALSEPPALRDSVSSRCRLGGVLAPRGVTG